MNQQQFEYAYLFGAVCAATGETEALIAPWVNKEIMQQHLDLISKRTEPERHAVVIMDGLGWHTDDIANLSIIKLSPYSPKLSPIEQVWCWLRQHHLSNRCFSGYSDIVDAWNDFVADIKRVKTLCARSWINMVI